MSTNEQHPTTPAPGSDTSVNGHPSLTHPAVLAAIRSGDVETMREQARQAETVGATALAADLRRFADAAGEQTPALYRETTAHVSDAARVEHARAVQGAAIDRAAGTSRGPLTPAECGDAPRLSHEQRDAALRRMIPDGLTVDVPDVEPRARVRHARHLRLAAQMIRRVERDGYGRNADATVAGIRGHLRAAQRIAATRLPADAQRAERFAALLTRADEIGAGL